MTDKIELDLIRQERAKEYAAIRRKLYIVDLVFVVVYLLVWLLSGLSAWWRDQVLALTPTNPWLVILIYAIGFGLVYGLLTAPLNYYSGFVLPHRYKISHQTLAAWVGDQLKGVAVAGTLGLVIVEILYALLRVAPTTWWVWISLFMLIFAVLLSNLAPVLLFPLFYKFTPLTNEELKNRLMRLAERAQTQVSGVYSFNESKKSSQANAALTGLGNTRRIILADTLIDNFSEDEIEVVLAHELGHHVHGDLGQGIVIQSLLTLVGFGLAHVVLTGGVRLLGYEGIADPAGFPLLALALSLYGLVTTPLGNLWSRWREVEADRYALTATHKPEAFIRAMTRLANQNLAEADPPAWVEFLLHSHPSINKRVAMAKAFQSQ